METIVEATNRILINVPSVRIKTVPTKQTIHSYIDLTLDDKSPTLQGC